MGGNLTYGGDHTLETTYTSTTPGAGTLIFQEFCCPGR